MVGGVITLIAIGGWMQLILVKHLDETKFNGWKTPLELFAVANAVVKCLRHFIGVNGLIEFKWNNPLGCAREGGGRVDN